MKSGVPNDSKYPTTDPPSQGYISALMNQVADLEIRISSLKSGGNSTLQTPMAVTNDNLSSKMTKPTPLNVLRELHKLLWAQISPPTRFARNISRPGSSYASHAWWSYSSRHSTRTTPTYGTPTSGGMQLTIGASPLKHATQKLARR